MKIINNDASYMLYNSNNLNIYEKLPTKVYKINFSPISRVRRNKR